jgi:hypothetical protein
MNVESNPLMREDAAKPDSTQDEIAKYTNRLMIVCDSRHRVKPHLSGGKPARTTGIKGKKPQTCKRGRTMLGSGLSGATSGQCIA